MDQRHGQIRLFLLYIAQNCLDPSGVHHLIVAVIIRVEQVDAIFTACRQGRTVHALGESHERNADILHLAQGVAAAFLKAFGICVHAQGLHTCRTDTVNGGAQTGHTIINGVGIGKLDQIHTRIIQSIHQALGGRSIFAAIGRANQVALKVQNGNIRLAQQIAHIQKRLGIIIIPGGHIHHPVRNHQVTGRSQMDHRVIGVRASVSTFAGAAKDPKKNTGHHQNRHKDAGTQQNQPLFFGRFIFLFALLPPFSQRFRIGDHGIPPFCSNLLVIVHHIRHFHKYKFQFIVPQER